MKKVFLVFIFIFLFAGYIYGNEWRITAACDPWAPFIDPQNPKEGISMEIIRAAFNTQGYKVDLKYLPWARAIKGVRSGKFDILPPTWKTSERQRTLLFSDSYAVNHIKFIKRKGDDFEFNNISDLDGKIVGVIRGYAYGDEFVNAEGFIKQSVVSFDMNLKKLLANRIDLTLEDEIVAKVKISKKYPGLFDKISFVSKPLSSENLYIASGYKNPRHLKIINAFNAGLKIIKEDGTYEKILKKYGLN